MPAPRLLFKAWIDYFMSRSPMPTQQIGGELLFPYWRRLILIKPSDIGEIILRKYDSLVQSGDNKILNNDVAFLAHCMVLVVGEQNNILNAGQQQTIFELLNGLHVGGTGCFQYMSSFIDQLKKIPTQTDPIDLLNDDDDDDLIVEATIIHSNLHKQNSLASVETISMLDSDSESDDLSIVSVSNTTSYNQITDHTNPLTRPRYTPPPGSLTTTPNNNSNTLHTSLDRQNYSSHPPYYTPSTPSTYDLDGMSDWHHYDHIILSSSPHSNSPRQLTHLTHQTSYRSNLPPPPKEPRKWQNLAIQSIYNPKYPQYEENTENDSNNNSTTTTTPSLAPLSKRIKSIMRPFYRPRLFNLTLPPSRISIKFVQNMDPFDISDDFLSKFFSNPILYPREIYGDSLISPNIFSLSSLRRMGYAFSHSKLNPIDKHHLTSFFIHLLQLFSKLRSVLIFNRRFVSYMNRPRSTTNQEYNDQSLEQKKHIQYQKAKESIQKHINAWGFDIQQVFYEFLKIISNFTLFPETIFPSHYPTGINVVNGTNDEVTQSDKADGEYRRNLGRVMDSTDDRSDLSTTTTPDHSITAASPLISSTIKSNSLVNGGETNTLPLPMETVQSIHSQLQAALAQYTTWISTLVIIYSAQFPRSLSKPILTNTIQKLKNQKNHQIVPFDDGVNLNKNTLFSDYNELLSIHEQVSHSKSLQESLGIDNLDDPESKLKLIKKFRSSASQKYLKGASRGLPVLVDSFQIETNPTNNSPGLVLDGMKGQGLDSIDGEGGQKIARKLFRVDLYNSIKLRQNWVRFDNTSPTPDQCCLLNDDLIDEPVQLAQPLQPTDFVQLSNELVTPSSMLSKNDENLNPIDADFYKLPGEQCGRASSEKPPVVEFDLTSVETPLYLNQSQLMNSNDLFSDDNNEVGKLSNERQFHPLAGTREYDNILHRLPTSSHNISATYSTLLNPTFHSLYSQFDLDFHYIEYHFISQSMRQMLSRIIDPIRRLERYKGLMMCIIVDLFRVMYMELLNSSAWFDGWDLMFLKSWADGVKVKEAMDSFVQELQQKRKDSILRPPNRMNFPQNLSTTTMSTSTAIPTLSSTSIVEKRTYEEFNNCCNHTDGFDGSNHDNAFSFKKQRRNSFQSGSNLEQRQNQLPPLSQQSRKNLHTILAPKDLVFYRTPTTITTILPNLPEYRQISPISRAEHDSDEFYTTQLRNFIDSSVLEQNLNRFVWNGKFQYFFPIILDIIRKRSNCIENACPGFRNAFLDCFNAKPGQTLYTNQGTNLPTKRQELVFTVPDLCIDSRRTSILKDKHDSNLSHTAAHTSSNINPFEKQTISHPQLSISFGLPIPTYTTTTKGYMKRRVVLGHDYDHGKQKISPRHSHPDQSNDIISKYPNLYLSDFFEIFQVPHTPVQIRTIDTNGNVIPDEDPIEMNHPCRGQIGIKSKVHFHPEMFLTLIHSLYYFFAPADAMRFYHPPNRAIDPVPLQLAFPLQDDWVPFHVDRDDSVLPNNSLTSQTGWEFDPNRIHYYSKPPTTPTGSNDRNRSDSSGRSFVQNTPHQTPRSESALNLCTMLFQFLRHTYRNNDNSNKKGIQETKGWNETLSKFLNRFMHSQNFNSSSIFTSLPSHQTFPRLNGGDDLPLQQNTRSIPNAERNNENASTHSQNPIEIDDEDDIEICAVTTPSISFYVPPMNRRHQTSRSSNRQNTGRWDNSWRSPKLAIKSGYNSNNGSYNDLNGLMESPVRPRASKSLSSQSDVMVLDSSDDDESSSTNESTPSTSSRGNVNCSINSHEISSASSSVNLAQPPPVQSEPKRAIKSSELNSFPNNSSKRNFSNRFKSYDGERDPSISSSTSSNTSSNTSPNSSFDSDYNPDGLMAERNLRSSGRSKKHVYSAPRRDKKSTKPINSTKKDKNKPGMSDSDEMSDEMSDENNSRESGEDEDEETDSPRSPLAKAQIPISILLKEGAIKLNLLEYAGELKEAEVLHKQYPDDPVYNFKASVQDWIYQVSYQIENNADLAGNTMEQMVMAAKTVSQDLDLEGDLNGSDSSSIPVVLSRPQSSTNHLSTALSPYKDAYRADLSTNIQSHLVIWSNLSSNSYSILLLHLLFQLRDSLLKILVEIGTFNSYYYIYLTFNATQRLKYESVQKDSGTLFEIVQPQQFFDFVIKLSNPTDPLHRLYQMYQHSSAPEHNIENQPKFKVRGRPQKGQFQHDELNLSCPIPSTLFVFFSQYQYVPVTPILAWAWPYVSKMYHIYTYNYGITQDVADNYRSCSLGPIERGFISSQLVFALHITALTIVNLNKTGFETDNISTPNQAPTAAQTLNPFSFPLSPPSIILTIRSILYALSHASAAMAQNLPLSLPDFTPDFLEPYGIIHTLDQVTMYRQTYQPVINKTSSLLRKSATMNTTGSSTNWYTELTDILDKSLTKLTKFPDVSPWHQIFLPGYQHLDIVRKDFWSLNGNRSNGIKSLLLSSSLQSSAAVHHVFSSSSLQLLLPYPKAQSPTTISHPNRTSTIDDRAYYSLNRGRKIRTKNFLSTKFKHLLTTDGFAFYSANKDSSMEPLFPFTVSLPSMDMSERGDDEIILSLGAAQDERPVKNDPSLLDYSLPIWANEIEPSHISQLRSNSPKHKKQSNSNATIFSKSPPTPLPFSSSRQEYDFFSFSIFSMVRCLETGSTGVESFTNKLSDKINCFLDGLGLRKVYSVIMGYYHFLTLVSPQSLFLPSGIDLTETEQDSDGQTERSAQIAKKSSSSKKCDSNAKDEPYSSPPLLPTVSEHTYQDDTPQPIFPINAVLTFSRSSPILKDEDIWGIILGFYQWLFEKGIKTVGTPSISSLTHFWDHRIEQGPLSERDSLRNSPTINTTDSVFLFNPIAIQGDALPTLHYLHPFWSIPEPPSSILSSGDHTPPHSTDADVIASPLPLPQPIINVLSSGTNIRHKEYYDLYTRSLPSPHQPGTSSQSQSPTASQHCVNFNLDETHEDQPTQYSELKERFTRYPPDHGVGYLSLEDDLLRNWSASSPVSNDPHGLSIDPLRYGNEGRMFNDAHGMGRVENTICLANVWTPAPVVSPPIVNVYHQDVKKYNEMIGVELFGQDAIDAGIIDSFRIETPPTFSTTTASPSSSSNYLHSNRQLSRNTTPRNNGQPISVNNQATNIPLAGLNGRLYFQFMTDKRSFCWAGSELFAQYGDSYWNSQKFKADDQTK